MIRRLNQSEAMTLMRLSINSWLNDYAPSMGAAIAYYTVLSFAPLLLIVITVAGLFFGEEAARGALSAELAQIVGANGAATIESILQASDSAEGGGMSLLLGSAMLFIGATTVFAELQSALDRIWKAPRELTSGITSLLRARLLSFGVILGAGFLLVVSLVMSAGISAITTLWGSHFAGSEALLQVLNFALGYAVVTGLFAMIYKILPSVPIAWKDVWIGAAVTSMLFSIGKFLIGLYIGKAALSSAFGAAGTIVVLVVWVYYSAQIFLLGAEFTYHYASRHGSRTGQAAPQTLPA